MQAASQDLYSQGQPNQETTSQQADSSAGSGSSDNAGSSQKSGGDDTVIDADYTMVDDDKKK
jgi:hypothetical protein